MVVMSGLPLYAGTIRVEVVPELGGLGSAPSPSAALGAVPLQLTANALIPAASLAAPVPALAGPLVAPTLVLAPLTPAALVPIQTAARPLLIKSLALPALDMSKLGVGDSSGAAEKDFNARAQLDAPVALGAGEVSAPASEGAQRREVSGLLTPASKRVPSTAGSVAAVKILEAAPAGTVLALDFIPTVKSLRVLSESKNEVILRRRKSDGQWFMSVGEGRAAASMGGYPSPEALDAAAGNDGRFFVISKAGVVEWNSSVPKGIASSLLATRLGRFVMRLPFPALYPSLLARRGVAAELKSWSKVTTAWLESGAAPLNETIVIEKVIPALVAQEFGVIAAKLGRSVDAAYKADVLKRTNGYRMYWHSSYSYKDHPDHMGIPDGHFRSDFGIRLMVKPDWRRIPDLAANFRPLFAHEYVHWLQNEGFVSTKFGAEIAAVAVEVLRAIELVGLEEVRAGRAATVHAGVMGSFDGGREWAREGFTNQSAPYMKGSLAGAAYEAAQVTGRPEASWEFLNLVIAEKGALEPAAAWARVVGDK